MRCILWKNLFFSNDEKINQNHSIMSIIEKTAQQLIQLCEAGKFDEAYQQLFAKDAKSIEPDGSTSDGLTAILQKSEAFKTDVEFVDCKMGTPQFAGNYFTLKEAFYSVIRKTGEKKLMEEIAVYKVENGKIVEERFFY